MNTNNKYNENFKNIKTKEIILKLIEVYYQNNYFNEETEEKNKKYNIFTNIDEYYNRLKTEIEEEKSNYKIEKEELKLNNYIDKYINFYFGTEDQILKTNKLLVLKELSNYIKQNEINTKDLFSNLESFCIKYTNEHEFITPSYILNIIKGKISEKYPENIKTRMDIEKEFINIENKRINNIIENGTAHPEEYNYIKKTYSHRYKDSIKTIFKLNGTKSYYEEQDLQEANKILLKMLNDAENQIKENIGNNTLNKIEKDKMHEQEKQKQQKKEEQLKKDIHNSLMIAKDFIDSQMLVKDYCRLREISPEGFNSAINKLQKYDEEIYIEVQNTINKKYLSEEEEQNVIKYIRNYNPNKSNLDILDYCALTTTPIQESILHFKNKKDNETVRGLNCFKSFYKERLVPVDYEELEKMKIIINGIELTKEDIENIKNIIDTEKYQHVKGIYIIIRNNYLNNTLDNIKRENVIKNIEIKTDPKKRVIK